MGAFSSHFPIKLEYFMCKIVVLDYVALAQNDLSLDVLKNFGEV